MLVLNSSLLNLTNSGLSVILSRNIRRFQRTTVSVYYTEKPEYFRLASARDFVGEENLCDVQPIAFFHK